MTAFEHVLRVLHRSAPDHILTSFLDPRKSSTVSRPGSDPNPFTSITNPSITNRPSFSSLHGVSSHVPSVSSEHGSASSHAAGQFALSIDTSGSVLRTERSGLSKESSNKGSVRYPDWRADAVMTAQRSGLGYVSKAMDVLLGGDQEQDDDEKEVQPRRTGKRKKSAKFKPPKDAWKKFDVGSKTGTTFVYSTALRLKFVSVQINEDVPGRTDSPSGSSAWDASPSPSSSSEQEDDDDDDSLFTSSETEWEGWKHDIKRQWMLNKPQSIPRSSVDSQPLDLSGYNLVDQSVDEDEDFLRRRVYSDTAVGPGRPLSPLSLTIADLSAAAALADDHSALWPPLFRTPGAVTTSTVSVGRPHIPGHGRKRSSTVTGNTPKKEKKGLLSSSKSKQKEKDDETGKTPMWRTRPPSLQMSSPSSRSPEEMEMLASASTARPRVTQPNSRPTSILRNSTASTIDYAAGAASSEQVFLQPPFPAAAGSGSSGRSSPGANVEVDEEEKTSKKGRWKRAPSLNGIVRGVSGKLLGAKPKPGV